MMAFENDGACVQGSPKWRDQHNINVQTLQLFLCTDSLLYSIFSYLYIHVFSIKFSIQIDLIVQVVLAYLMLNDLLSSVVLGFSVTDEVNHQKYNIMLELQSIKFKRTFLIVFCLGILDFHNYSMDRQHKSQQQSKTQTRLKKQKVKLPYLNSNLHMPYPYQARTKKSDSVHRDFNLHTNFISIPRYSALEDKNLAYFFDKATNMKLLEQLRMEQTRKSNKSNYSNKSKGKEAKTQREAPQNRSWQVSQVDFLQYIQKMKKNIEKQPANS